MRHVLSPTEGKSLLSAITAAIIAVSTLYSTPAVEAPKAQTVQVQETVKEKRKECNDPLVKWIREAGFKGKSVRVAWSIAMRESNGNPRAISPSNDYGLFQINAGAWSGQSWWNSSSMLDPKYNARIAYKLSKGGKYWAMWGLDANGNLDATYYQSWGPDLWDAWIMSPFRKYYSQFPKKCM